MRWSFITKPRTLAGIAGIITAKASVVTALYPHPSPDNTEQSSSPQLSNNVPKIPPIALITGKTEAYAGEFVTLYGTSSTDIDGKIMAYAWDQLDRIPIDLQSEGIEKTAFTAPFSNDRLSFRLMVTDNDALNAMDTADVIVKYVSQNQNVTTDHEIDNGKVPVIEGTEECDVLNGTSMDDHIEGHGKDNTIYGLGGNDELEGGKGNDKLYGDEGDDIVQGESKGDELFGGNGNDQISAGDRDDKLSGDAGDDQLIGGLGIDTFACGTGRDTILDFSMV